MLGAGGQSAAWQPLLHKLLDEDESFHQTAEGRWTARADAPAEAGEGAYTIVETLLFQPPGTPGLDLECAAIRLAPDGQTDRRVTLIGPEAPLPPATRLPKGLSRARLSSAPGREDVIRELVSFAAGTTIVSFSSGPLISALLARMEDTALITLKKLHRALTGSTAPRSLPELAQAWEVFCPDEARAEERASVTADILGLMQAEAEQQGKANLAEALTAAKARVSADFDRYGFGPEFLDDLPRSPGAYIMKDANGAVIYVGKACDLRSRVGSYFRPKLKREEKEESILDAVHTIAIERAGSELEALLLEYRLIRELRPPINLQYEVHERPAGYVRGENVILILPSARDDSAEIFLLKGEERFRQLRVPLTRPLRARRPIERMYFIPTRGQRISETNRGELEIAWSWLARHRDKVNMLKVDQAGDLDDLMRLLRDHLADESLHGQRVYRV